MSGIKPLPAVAVRLLGAGQAIQDAPAVIKELLDNAIDARASNISIEVSSNLLDLLQVRDNGHGIPASDRHLLCQRHCTSKISSEHDLNNIGGSSLGFRGEALSSIAASSGFLSITTRTKDEPVSMVMTFDTQGNIISTTRASMAVGTVVKVADFLKHNPVRHKTALSKASASLQKVKRVLHAYACARPSLRLSLKVVRQDGKHDFLYVPGQAPSVLDAVTKLFGMHCASQCMAVDTKHGSISMAAVLPREDAESDHVSGLGCFISCDGRPMSANKSTFKQIRAMFGVRVAIEREALLVLHISCAPGMYDVNVEPAKDDVIFEDATVIIEAARQLFASVYKQSKALSTVTAFNGTLLTPLPSSGTVEEGNSDVPVNQSFAQSIGASATHGTSHEDRQDSTRALSQSIVPLFSSQASARTHSQRGRSSFKPRGRQKARVNKPFVPPSVQGRQDRVWFDHLEPYEQARGAAPRSTPRGSQNFSDSLGDLLHNPQPLSPPRHNTDIRSFCQPVRASGTLTSNAAHDDHHRRAPSQRKYTSERLSPSSGQFDDEELSAEMFDKVLAGQTDSHLVIPVTPPQSSMPLSASNALPNVKHAQLQKPATGGTASKQHREASSQLLAWSMLSPASKMCYELETSVQAIAELAVTLNVCRSMPPMETAVADYQMPWVEECTDEDVESIAAGIERRLEPCDPRRSIILRLAGSIKQAIAAHLRCDASSEIASSDTDLLL